MVVANVLGPRESLCQTRGEAVPLMEKEGHPELSGGWFFLT